MAPTLCEIDISLSLRTTISLVRRCPIWLRASQETPPVRLPSPTTAMMRWDSAFLVTGHGHAQGGREGGAGVPGVVDVVGAFVAVREAQDAAALAQAAEEIAPSGDDLVGVGLVPDVPDDLVGGGVEDPVQGQGDLDDAQVGGQMPAVLGDHIQDHGPDLGGQARQLVGRKLAQILRPVDRIENTAHFGSSE